MGDRKGGLLSSLALVVAAVGVIVPIAWDRYQSKSALELRLTSAATIVEAPKDVGQLQVMYQGRPVPRLTRIVFTLENTGRRPIRDTDIVIPPTIQVPSPAEMLDIALAAAEPSELVLRPSLHPSQRIARVTFSLLNPGDQAAFSVLTTGTTDEIRASARIAGVPNIRIRRADSEKRSGAAGRSWTVYVAAAATVFSWFVALALISAVGAERQLSLLYRRGALPIPHYATPTEYLKYLQSALLPVKAHELNGVKQHLLSLPANEAMTREQTATIAKQIGDAITDMRTVIAAALVFGAFAAVGTWYVVREVIAL